MKKIFVLMLVAIVLFNGRTNSQAVKIGVFDIDIMVQAMPGYHVVDSLMQIFDRDTLGALREYNESEYRRLDSTYKSDSVLVAQGKKPKTILDIVTAERQKAIINVVYFLQL